MINEVDVDGNGIIDFPEFIAMMAKKAHIGDTEDDIREAFRVFDHEGRGVISVDQLRHVMTELGDKMPEDEFDELLSEIDVDKNGHIHYEEMVKIMSEK